MSDMSDTEISDIYEHPQSKLFTKMLGLAGSKAVPSLASDPTSDPTDVRVLDRKLEEDEERLKKDNKRWRGIIYLTVAVCLVIFCLVVTQVISSVTSSAKPLPNIDVSEPHSSDKSPRPEPLVASLSSLPGAYQKPGEDLPEPVETDVVEIETMVAKIAAEESEKEEEELEAKTSVEESLSGDLEGQPGTLEFIPVPLGDEEEKEKEAAKEDEAESPRATTRRPPLFIPMMFEQRGVAFDNPIPEFIRRHFMSMMGPTPQLQAKQPPPPFEVPSKRPRHPFLELFFKGEPDLAPPSLRQEAVIVTELPQEDLPTPEKNPFLSDVLRGMKALLQTMKPLLADEPLPEELPFPSPLRPAARLIGGLERRPPPQRSFMAPQGRAFPSRFPQPQPRRPGPQQQRGFGSPPVAFRPGPLRAPVSVVPPQPANQRRFPQRPTNQRVFPPRGPAPPRNFHQSPPVNQRQQFQRPPFLPQLHESSSTRHFNNNPRRPETLVGNPLYSYPNTATGIQDIIQHIRQDKRPQNGHGAFQAPGPNIHFSSSDRFNNNGGFHGNSHHHDNGGNHHGNEGYSGPIYPPGYEEQQIELGSPDQPFHLMLDVYPVEDSDRYEASDVYFGSPPNVNNRQFSNHGGGGSGGGGNQQNYNNRNHGYQNNNDNHYNQNHNGNHNQHYDNGYQYNSGNHGNHNYNGNQNNQGNQGNYNSYSLGGNENFNGGNYNQQNGNFNNRNDNIRGQYFGDGNSGNANSGVEYFSGNDQYNSNGKPYYGFSSSNSYNSNYNDNYQPSFNNNNNRNYNVQGSYNGNSYRQNNPSYNYNNNQFNSNGNNNQYNNHNQPYNNNQFDNNNHYSNGRNHQNNNYHQNNDYNHRGPQTNNHNGNPPYFNNGNEQSFNNRGRPHGSSNGGDGFGSGGGSRFNSNTGVYSDSNKHEIILHLNFYSRRPSSYTGSASSSNSMSLEIPVGRNQLTPQMLYDAIVGGQWRRRTDVPRYDFLQEMASTRDRVGVDLFPVEEAPKIVAALEKKLFGSDQLQSSSDATDRKFVETEDGGEQEEGEGDRPSTVHRVNDLTEGYLRPDQVTRPPVTSRPTVTSPPTGPLEPLPTPLARVAVKDGASEAVKLK